MRHRWKGHLSDIMILFRYFENILISRLYERFSRNGPGMAVRNNFKLLKYKHLKHVIWRFRIRNYFCEIIKFRNFMDNDIFCEIVKALVITYSKSSDHINLEKDFIIRRFELSPSLGMVVRNGKNILKIAEIR